MNAIGSFLIVLSMLPFFPFLIVYYGMVYFKKPKKTALHMAMDVTTIFLIAAVAALFNSTFNLNFGVYLILLVMLIALGLIGSAQTRLKGKINYRRMIRAVWRMAFVVMGFSYIVLLAFGLFSYIIDFM
ncbi:DUF3397 domain-containing protein [Paenibacillus urinalis]|uniref:DUF3397 domain-containing protein n=2 Tax=Paenibacillus TaxID=44249 RepID=A0AAX3MWN3_9BACL|nr:MULTISPECIES: DUF3397 domain-containing protein [Paenibacillus]WDH81541.1 DUF3397 domain-containing protein [Paenibacillus urinalis]WDH97586.1 DUF3397 domain-containing protein [Paenibacillus urinalis]WDI01256.1 DUF3397 domain-containing protein [Paenibacillus urinalis]SDX08212.1 Protein of unknown function [Paenibacillus sp. PDC88]GAK39679.1 hypothetical protein TCA2_2168 [Paenibacillus sp. TCA20]